MTRTKPTRVAFALGMLLSANAGAAELLGHTTSEPSDLYLIDTVAQTETLQGTLNISSPSGWGRCPDIELGPNGNTLVCVEPDGPAFLFDSGDGSSISSSPITYPTVPGDTLNVATALEYIGNTLYASFDDAGPETGPGWLGTLDPTTGDTTLIGELVGMNAPTGGLAYDGGTLYAVSSANSVFSELYTVNSATGAATKIADITLGGDQVEAMTALTIVDGIAYTKSNDTTGGTDQDTLYRLDLTSGALTPVYTMTAGNFVGLTSAASPTAQSIPVMPGWALAFLGALLGGLGLTRLRKHNAEKRRPA